LGFSDLPDLDRAVMLVLLALVYNNALRKNSYPKYW